MVTYADVEAADEAIKLRWQTDSNLKDCRGYLFNITYSEDRPIKSMGPIDVVIMGMNPGENLEHENAINKAGEKSWKRNCQFFADAAGGRWTTSEMF
jgi:hypothetical protein